MINWFFVHIFPLYKLLYFFYKNLSDRHEIAWMTNYIKEGMIVVDVGANIGFYTLLLSKLVGEKGKVYAFEPEKVNFNFLKKNTRGKSNIYLNNIAVGQKNEVIKLYYSKSLNVDHRTYKTEESRNFKKIQCVSLDSFFRQRKVDFIKIDIQGYDYFAIKGMQNLIRRQRKIALVGEYWPYGLKIAGINPKKYLNLLESMHLKVVLNNKKPIEEIINNKYYYTNFIAYK